MFVVLVTSKEARTGAAGNKIMTKEGQQFWAERDPDGFVEASSTQCDDKNVIPANTKTWDTFEAAEEFAKRWKGHPWWCVPNGEYEIFKVKQKFRLVPDGYTRVKRNGEAA